MKERILKILIVDDEEVLTLGYSKCLIKVGYEVKTASSGEEAIKLLKDEMFDLVLLDIRLPHMSGMEVLSKALEIDPDLIVIMITAHGSVQSAVDAMRMGAFDYLLKGFDHEELRTVVKKALDMYRLKREVSQLQENERKNYPDIAIFGNSPKIKYIKDLIKVVARTPKTSVLIEGESGTGKEMIAKAIHFASPRKDRSFLAVNCAALAENLLESELFGHEKGAFTGADRLRKGRFEMANHGTLFIDEIGEIPLATQVKLLRVLQEQTFERVGGSEPITVDVRIVAATNRNLEDLIEEGRFREDLYYRLNVVRINIPPLRKRKSDIPLLVDYFLKKYSTENNKKMTGISKEAMDQLMKYDYPGNVRELENIIEQSVVLGRGDMISVRDLPMTVKGMRSESKKVDPFGEGIFIERVEAFEKELIDQALEQAQGVQTRAAKILGITERHLRYKLNKYGMK